MTYTIRIHAATEGGLAEALRRELRALGDLDYDGSPFSVEYDVDPEESAPFEMDLTDRDRGALVGAMLDEEAEPNEALKRAARDLDEVLDRSVPTDVQTHDDGWIRHTGGERPVQAMDVVDVCFDRFESRDRGYGRESFRRVASLVAWSRVTGYRPLRDPEGIPYCSAEGLELWAEYVATDEDGEAWQFENKPFCEEDIGKWFAAACRRGHAAHHDNTPQHWTETLRRVWRN